MTNVIDRIIRGILRIPPKEDTNNFRNNIWRRYTGQEFPLYGGVNVSDLDKASGYMERIIDRITNKARGILPFNTILLALVGITRSPSSNMMYIYTILILLSVSSLILLSLFLVHWGKIDHYQKFEDEFDTTVDIIRIRSYFLQLAIIFSFLGFIGVVVLGLADHLHIRISPPTGIFHLKDSSPASVTPPTTVAKPPAAATQ